MNKLEKSVRSVLKYYGTDLRAGRYWPHGAVGLLPPKFRGYVAKVIIDVEDGIAINCMIYTVGDAIEAAHYRGAGIDITAVTEEYLKDGDKSWDDYIKDVCDVIVNADTQE